MNKQQVIRRAAEKFKDAESFDIVKFAQELGIDVYYKKDIFSLFKSLSKDFNAKIRFNSKKEKYEIFVNPFHPLTRQRFSVAHEIAHFVLHKDVIVQNGNGISRDTTSQTDPATFGSTSKMESDADELAAKILMPREVIEEYMQKKDYDKDEPLEEEDIKKIAEHFKVSPLVVIVRLRNLDYVIPYIEFS